MKGHVCTKNLLLIRKTCPCTKKVVLVGTRESGLREVETSGVGTSGAGTTGSYGFGFSKYAVNFLDNEPSINI